MTCALLTCALIPCALLTVVGCDSAGEKGPPVGVRQLEDEKAKLQRQLEQARAENEQLKKQVEVLSNLPGEVRAETLYRLKAIRVGRYTNFYDNDKDGRRETLTVYLAPIDEQGDAVKAAGAVDVQLWNLDNKDGDAMLAQWRIEPGELKKMWFATLTASNYRLNFEAEKFAAAKSPLTVKVTFTDYLSGTVFTEQRVIKP